MSFAEQVTAFLGSSREDLARKMIHELYNGKQPTKAQQKRLMSALHNAAWSENEPG